MQDNAQRLGGKIANVYRRIPERRTGFGGTLWPTAFPCSTLCRRFFDKISAEVNSAGILCYGDVDERCSGGKGAKNGDSGKSVSKANSSDTPEPSENSGLRSE